MEDKKKRGGKKNASPKSERKIVLRDLKASEYAGKKYTIKKAARSIPLTGGYLDNRSNAEQSHSSDDRKTDKPKKEKAFKAQQTQKSDSSRMKKAAYIKEELEHDIAASYSEQFDDPDNREEIPAADNADAEIIPDKTDTKAKAEKSTLKQVNSDTADVSQRMKKAAFIKEKLQKDIALSKVNTVREEASDTFASEARPPMGDGNEAGKAVPEMPPKFESKYLGNTDRLSENEYKNSLENEKVRQAYKSRILEKRIESRRNAIDMHGQARTNAALIAAEKAKTAALKNAESEEFVRDNIVPGAEMAAEYISAVKSGDAAKMLTQPAVSLIKNHLGGMGQAMDGAAMVSGTVQSADSVGGAAANTVTSLAASRIKSAVSDSLFKPTDRQIEERFEKKFRYIDRKTDKQMSKIQSEKGEAMNGNISKNLEKQIDKIERNQDKYRQKLHKQQKELQRRQQKNIYIKHNRGNPAFVGNRLKGKAIKGAAKSKLLLLGAGSSALVVILIIILLLILISSMFSWLTPFDFSLAGDDSDDPNATATTEAEILDGYTLMIQNYMDVSQAYYYLKYGDWYGGEYDYPAPNITYADFLAEYQSAAIQRIQDKYAALFAAATSSMEISMLSQAMSAEMRAALQAAAEQALNEYNAQMDALDDALSAAERRQHYEVYDSGGGNGTADSAEFSGKPIVGTNSFGNVEINSDLSAEELLAMTALYKSLKSMDDTGGESEEETAEDVYSITPQDMMDFFKETEFITITTEITHDNTCDGRCRRRLTGDAKTGYSWEYYCDSDHDFLSGEIEACKTQDELIEKIIELTNAEGNGIDKDSCEEIIEAYLDLIKEKLEISEGDFRQFGAADNERAKEFYEILIDPEKGEIPNNYWTVETPND